MCLTGFAGAEILLHASRVFPQAAKANKKRPPGTVCDLHFAEGHSVDTRASLFNAACIVCHGSVAHFTRTGISRTPENTFKFPKRSATCSSSESLVTIS